VRRFKNISKSKQNILREQFSHIYALYRAGEESELNQLSVSVFDHWLRGNEVEIELSDVSSVMQAERDSKLHRFSCLLTEKTDAYLVQLKGIGKTTLVFKQFLGEDGKSATLKPLAYNFGSKGRFVLALPKLGVLYFEWWDFTHHFYYTNNADLDPIREVAESCDVYLL
jgi:hypothetical protein